MGSQTKIAKDGYMTTALNYILAAVLILQLFSRITTPFQGVLLTMLENSMNSAAAALLRRGRQMAKAIFSALRLCLTNAQFMQNFLSCAEFEMDHKRTLA